ncbi:MAG: LPS biosynthesis protein [Odoribacter sp.]
MNLKDKKILLFAPGGCTGHYGSHISKELERRGAMVVSYDERPSQNSYSKIAIRLLKKRLPFIFSKYIDEIIKLYADINFDFIFVIRGEAFMPQSVKRLNVAFPDARLILFLWDILATTNVKEIIPFFDRVLTFDPEDATYDTKMVFRPLFFLDCFKQISVQKSYQYDVFFSGTIHSNRFTILKQVKKNLELGNLIFYFYYFLPAKIVFFQNKIFNKSFKHAHLKDFNYKPLTLCENLDKIQKSRCILDIRYPGQKSMSMRVFEAIGANRKLITNNPEIRFYNFYNENNIWVIDENSFKVPASFFETPYQGIPENIYNEYTLASWIDDVFNFEEVKSYFL